MPNLPIDQLKTGMILSEDVIGVNGKLFLSKGKTVRNNHLTVFKTWGIREVAVQEPSNDANENDVSAPNPEKIRQVAENLKTAFADNDLGHPAVAEIFRHSVLHRSRKPEDHRKPARMNTTAPDTPNLNPGKGMRQKISNREIDLPEIPSIIFQLNDTIADPFSSAEDIARVINKSPGLSALLLRIVNSAFYGFPSRIDTVTRAVTIIGSKEVSALAVGITTMEIFKDIPKEVFDMQAFTHHNLACGVLARTISASGNIRNTEQMFVSGLLHDIGRLVIFKHFPKESAWMLSSSEEQNAMLYDTEKAMMGFRHTDVAADLFKKWNFPVALSQNVIYHHRPLSAQDPVKAAVIHLADIIAHSLGEGRSGELRVPTLNADAWEKLRLSAKSLSVIMDQAIDHLDFLVTVFSEDK